tara:strand:+ start:50 stop:355 length:306 start_codon:yes stop_codon:yes gene_type:complete
MNQSELLLTLLIGNLFLGMGVCEFIFRKGKDADWIKKATRNKSARKYSAEISREELLKLSPQQQQELFKAGSRAELLFCIRIAGLLMICLILGIYIYHGGK